MVTAIDRFQRSAEYGKIERYAGKNDVANTAIAQFLEVEDMDHVGLPTLSDPVSAFSEALWARSHTAGLQWRAMMRSGVRIQGPARYCSDGAY
jgi:hypothetical protein